MLATQNKQESRQVQQPSAIEQLKLGNLPMADESTLAELKANNSYLSAQEWDSIIKSRGDVGGPSHEYDDVGMPVKSVYGSIGQFNEDVNKIK